MTVTYVVITQCTAIVSIIASNEAAVSLSAAREQSRSDVVPHCMPPRVLTALYPLSRISAVSNQGLQDAVACVFDQNRWCSTLCLQPPPQFSSCIMSDDPSLNVINKLLSLGTGTSPVLPVFVLKQSMMSPSFPILLQVVREASKRVLGLRPFDVQLIGGMILHEGQIAEMRTGRQCRAPGLSSVIDSSMGRVQDQSATHHQHAAPCIPTSRTSYHSTVSSVEVQQHTSFWQYNLGEGAV